MAAATLSPEARGVLQRALQTMKSRGIEGWCRGYLTDNHGRWCAQGRIHQADPDLTIHGNSPAFQQITRAGHDLGLPPLFCVNDAEHGYIHAINWMEQVLSETLPGWEPSRVQGSQHDVVDEPALD